MQVKKNKYYKTRPKQRFWKNGDVLECISPLTRDSNMLHFVNVKSKKIGGCCIIGYLLRKGSVKITKEEFERVYGK